MSNQNAQEGNDLKETLYYNRRPISGGIYGSEVYTQWLKLLFEVRDFMPGHAVSGSIGGTCAMMRAKAKAIETTAKGLVEITKAVLSDRK